MIKLVDEALLVEIRKWWRHFNFPDMSQVVTDHGFVSIINDKPVCCGWLYFPVDGKICWLNWVTSNPEAKPNEKEDGFKELSDEVKKQAKENGMATVFTSTNCDSLVKRLNGNGFTVADRNVTHLFYNTGTICHL